MDLLILIFHAGFLAGLIFFGRFLCKPKRFFKNYRLHLPLFLLWAVFGYFSFCSFVIMNPQAWPPRWWDRMQQRKIIVSRVQVAGGWKAIHDACETLATNRLERDRFWWTRGNNSPWLYDMNSHSQVTNEDYWPLPPTLAALEPQRMDWYLPSECGSNLLVIRMKIFGLHSTGGHSTPYYGLDVVSGANANSYSPERSDRSTGRVSYKKVAENVYEVTAR